MSKRIVLASVTLALLVPVFAASTRSDDAQRVQRANQVFKEIMQTADRGIPREILEGAECLAIVPGEKNFALGFGGTYGKGVVSCRHGRIWSAPMFIQVGGGSWGLQIGGQSTDIVMVFRTRDGLSHLLANKVKIGAAANAAAGPVGRHVSASTDASLHAEILTYSRSRGAFAGISLDGDIVQPDDSGDRAMYGKASWQEILGGHTEVRKSSRPLIATLDRYTIAQP